MIDISIAGFIIGAVCMHERMYIYMRTCQSYTYMYYYATEGFEGVAGGGGGRWGGTYKSHQLGGRRAHLMAGMREGKNVVVVPKGTIEAICNTQCKGFLDNGRHGGRESEKERERERDREKEI